MSDILSQPADRQPSVREARSIRQHHADERQPSVREARSIRQHHAAERELALRAEAAAVTVDR